MILYAQVSYFFPEIPLEKNVGGVGCFLEQICSQDVALSCDKHFFVIKSLLLVQQIMALNWFVLPAPSDSCNLLKGLWGNTGNTYMPLKS